MKRLWEFFRMNKFLEENLAYGYFGAPNKYVIKHLLERRKEAEETKRSSDNSLRGTKHFQEHLKQFQPPAHVYMLAYISHAIPWLVVQFRTHLQATAI